MKIRRGYSSFVVLMALGACGSSGGGSAGPDSFEELSIRGAQLLEEYNDAELTPAVDMPTSGSATYEGVGAYSFTHSDPAAIAADPETLSNVTFEADFADGELDGRAYNFRNNSGVAVAGSLDISGGTITGNQFDADISGTLTEDGVAVSYDGELGGAFVGDDANAIIGYGYADGTVPGFGTARAYAVFGAER